MALSEHKRLFYKSGMQMEPSMYVEGAPCMDLFHSVLVSIFKLSLHKPYIQTTPMLLNNHQDTELYYPIGFSNNSILTQFHMLPSGLVHSWFTSSRECCAQICSVYSVLTSRLLVEPPRPLKAVLTHAFYL